MKSQLMSQHTPLLGLKRQRQEQETGPLLSWCLHSSWKKTGGFKLWRSKEDLLNEVLSRWSYKGLKRVQPNSPALWETAGRLGCRISQARGLTSVETLTRDCWGGSTACLLRRVGKWGQNLQGLDGPGRGLNFILSPKENHWKPPSRKVRHLYL